MDEMDRSHEGRCVMRITNKHGLPQTIVNAVGKSRKPIPGRYGVNDLIGAPLARRLKMEHWDELKQDVSEMLWMLLGSAVHSVLEIHAPAESLSEEKMVVNFQGIYQIVGIPDLYHDHQINDYKITSVYSFLLGDKPEWTNQCNVYAFLFREQGFKVDGLNIHAILRDWQQSKAMRDSDYPKIPFHTVKLPLWSHWDSLKYVNDRVEAHAAAENMPIQDIAPCTDDERWARPTTWAVVKEGRKSALRVLDSQEKAECWLQAQKDTKGLSVEIRPGEYMKCQNYCVVRDVCPYLNYL